MNGSIFVALINNTALLLALVMLYDMISRPSAGMRSYAGKLFGGAVIGVIGIAVMGDAWRYSAGIVFDTRTILMSVAGLFFGLIPTAMAGAITIAFRIYSGGAGMAMGVTTIITSAVTGLIWRSHRRSLKRLFGRFELYVFGIIVHATMILCILLLPAAARREVFGILALPVMAIYPVATVFMGSLLDIRSLHISGEETVRANERKFRKMMERSSDIITLLDADGKVRQTTESATRILGYNPFERLGFSALDIVHPDDLPQAETVLKSLMETPGSTRSLAVRYRNKNGEYVWMESSLTNMLDDPDVKAVVVNSRDISARHAAEDELRITARRLSLSTDAGKIGTWEYDMESGAIIWDARVYEMYGIGPEIPLSYDMWLGTLHPDDREAASRRIQESIGGGKSYHTQFRIVRPDGRLRYVEAHGDVFRDANGAPRRMIGVNWDITDRMEAERELRESEARFRLLVESAPDAIYVQTEHRFAYLNSMAVELFGAENAGQLVGQLIMERIHPDYGNVIRERIHRLRDEHLSVPPLEEVFLRLDGSTVDVEVSAVPIWYGGKDSTLVFVRDISARKHAEQSLRDSEERYRQLFNTMMNGFALHEIICNDAGDPMDYRFLEVNPAFERLTGLKADEIIGKTVLEVLPHTEHVWIERYGRVALTGEPVMFENIAEELGKYYHVTAYSPRRGLFAVIFEDVSERKRAEEERELIEIQLRQAQKMEAVGRLAGGVAHDFNNMLSVILGNVEIALTRAGPDTPLTTELQEIRQAGERSAGLTRQLLAFSRKQLVEPQVIDLNEAIAYQKNMLVRLIGEDISITFRPAEKLWSIRIDPFQIGQILTNLAINARDAVSGVGAITIETANVSLDESYTRRNAYVIPGEYVLLSFTDTGAGMDKETQEQIFEPFFTTKQEGLGTGLGLSTVYGIVKQNAGVINVYSEPGMGTTFKVYFPRHDGAPGAIPVEQTEPPLEGTETILVVEDEDQILELSRRMLTRFGYAVLTARTPLEAIRLAIESKGNIQLLLTDVVMPGMNGKQLEEQIRKEAPGIKTLFMSGYTANVIAERGVIDEGVHFIHKPFTINGLAKKVRAVLDG